MKLGTMSLIRGIAVLMIVALSANLSGCYVTTKQKPKTNNGKHKGWYKNTNNPHHPQTTNPGHTKKDAPKSNGKSKGKKNK